MSDKTPQSFFKRTSNRFNTEQLENERNPEEDSAKGNVKVICRFRPLNSKEKEYSERSCIEFGSDLKSVRMLTQSDAGCLPVFNFDRVFSPDSSQAEVYEMAARPVVESVLEGFNGTILAYGQTSSGKTFTMSGPSLDDPVYRGIIPRMVKTVFQSIQEADEHLEFAVKVGYCEIYLEKIKDLFNPSRGDLKIMEDRTRGIFIENLTEEYVSQEEEVYQLMKMGGKNREVAATNMNEGSSRSHAIFILTISQSNTTDMSEKTGKLYLVDLAGSEKISKTGAEGKRLDEAKKINLSLTTLGLVIYSLTDGKSTHVPYRDSKLTRILQESLGGNSKTTLILTCSPSSYNEQETISTLRFGIRAKSIKNKPKINKEFTVAELKLLLAKAQEEIKQKEIKIGLLEKRAIDSGRNSSRDTEETSVNENDLQGLIQELELEREHLAEEIEKNNELSQDLAIQTARAQSLARENEEVNSKLMDILFSMQSIEDKLQDSEEAVCKLTAKNENLKKIIDSLQEALAEANLTISKKEMEMQNLLLNTTPIKDKEDLIAEVKNLREKYQLQEEQLKAHYSRIIQDCNNAKAEEITSTSIEINTLIEEKMQLSSDLRSKFDVIYSLEQKIIQKDQEFQKIEIAKKEYEDHMKGKVSNLEKSFGQLMKKMADDLSAYKQKCGIYKERALKYKERCEKLKERLSEIRQKIRDHRGTENKPESPQKQHAQIVKKVKGGGNSRLLGLLSFSAFSSPYKRKD
ncbi:unnamed protein product [Blepharisma stoltei]|uniref:Kinesin-like protein n=1 Tax=Blepharisma stoltei TaxID=1481888 RepID=A0AAU9JCT1_9CILI|nr:unnamed protein product [Blepharisma stoltei]